MGHELSSFSQNHRFRNIVVSNLSVLIYRTPKHSKRSVKKISSALSKFFRTLACHEARSKKAMDARGNENKIPPSRFLAPAPPNPRCAGRWCIDLSRLMHLGLWCALCELHRQKPAREKRGSLSGGTEAGELDEEMSRGLIFIGAWECWFVIGEWCSSRRNSWKLWWKL